MKIAYTALGIDPLNNRYGPYIFNLIHKVKRRESYVFNYILLLFLLITRIC